ncbi:MAG: hypothetical protein P1P74_12545, partial [Desulfuromonadales bacterium]|nr:hypothetical protein [Desulfuromonadales bacterium]
EQQDRNLLIFWFSLRYCSEYERLIHDLGQVMLDQGMPTEKPLSPCRGNMDHEPEPEPAE